MSTQNYKVLSSVRHGGHEHLPGDLIELDEADAGPLLALRHPAIAVIDDQLEAKAPAGDVVIDGPDALALMSNLVAATKAGAEQVAAEQVAAEPVATEPAVTEPAVTEPAAAEPVATEPAATKPALAKKAPAKKAPAKKAPAKKAPAKKAD